MNGHNSIGAGCPHRLACHRWFCKKHTHDTTDHRPEAAPTRKSNFLNRVSASAPKESSPIVQAALLPLEILKPPNSSARDFDSPAQTPDPPRPAPESSYCPSSSTTSRPPRVYSLSGYAAGPPPVSADYANSAKDQLPSTGYNPVKSLPSFQSQPQPQPSRPQPQLSVQARPAVPVPQARQSQVVPQPQFLPQPRLPQHPVQTRPPPEQAPPQNPTQPAPAARPTRISTQYSIQPSPQFLAQAQPVFTALTQSQYSAQPPFQFPDQSQAQIPAQYPDQTSTQRQAQIPVQYPDQASTQRIAWSPPKYLQQPPVPAQAQPQQPEQCPPQLPQRIARSPPQYSQTQPPQPQGRQAPPQVPPQQRNQIPTQPTRPSQPLHLAQLQTPSYPPLQGVPFRSSQEPERVSESNQSRTSNATRSNPSVPARVHSPPRPVLPWPKPPPQIQQVLDQAQEQQVLSIAHEEFAPEEESTSIRVESEYSERTTIEREEELPEDTETVSTVSSDDRSSRPSLKHPRTRPNKRVLMSRLPNMRGTAGPASLQSSHTPMGRPISASGAPVAAATPPSASQRVFTVPPHPYGTIIPRFSGGTYPNQHHTREPPPHNQGFVPRPPVGFPQHMRQSDLLSQQIGPGNNYPLNLRSMAPNYPSGHFNKMGPNVIPCCGRRSAPCFDDGLHEPRTDCPRSNKHYHIPMKSDETETLDNIMLESPARPTMYQQHRVPQIPPHVGQMSLIQQAELYEQHQQPPTQHHPHMQEQNAHRQLNAALEQNAHHQLIPAQEQNHHLNTAMGPNAHHQLNTAQEQSAHHQLIPAQEHNAHHQLNTAQEQSAHHQLIPAQEHNAHHQLNTAQEHNSHPQLNMTQEHNSLHQLNTAQASGQQSSYPNEDQQQDDQTPPVPPCYAQPAQQQDHHRAPFSQKQQQDHHNSTGHAQQPQVETEVVQASELHEDNRPILSVNTAHSPFLTGTVVGGHIQNICKNNQRPSCAQTQMMMHQQQQQHQLNQYQAYQMQHHPLQQRQASPQSYVQLGGYPPTTAAYARTPCGSFGQNITERPFKTSLTPTASQLCPSGIGGGVRPAASCPAELRVSHKHTTMMQPGNRRTSSQQAARSRSAGRMSESPTYHHWES